jgi:hypothetical protein
MRSAFLIARIFITTCELLASIGALAAQPRLNVGPNEIQFRAVADSFDLPSPRMLGIGPVGTTDPVPFKFAGGYFSNEPNFLVVSPSSGVTPALLWVALNPNVVAYLPSGAHAISLQFAAPGETCPPCAATLVGLSLGSRSPAVNSVVNSATQQPGISPGAIVSILGTNLGTPPITGRFDSGGLYPTSLGNSTVTVNGAAAPLRRCSM